MNIEMKTENNITKKHFAKLHEKIQSKYVEMQRKLEKSKSVDTLLDKSDQYLIHNQNSFTSVCDLGPVNGDVSVRSTMERKYEHSQSISYLDKNSDAVLSDILYDNINIIDTESVSISNEIKYQETDNVEDNEVFSKSSISISLESLNEVAKESDESSEPITPPRKSIRHRIQLRFKKRKESKTKFKDYFLTNSPKYIPKAAKKTKTGTVTVALVEVKGLEEVEEERQRILFFRFRLGGEKKKSKTVRSSHKDIKFQELFTFNLYDDDYILIASLWDRDICIGSYILNLIDIDKEKTHQMRIKLEGEHNNVECFFLLTISGTSINTLYDNNEYELAESQYLIKRKYAWYRLTGQLSNVGTLRVIVYGAKGLLSQGFYCVLKLSNERIQTQTDWKTNDPNWMKIMTFKITDITSILEVFIYDEKKSEAVGGVFIPLLKIKPGKKWFALKDSTLKEKAKGNNPRILLDMDVSWNFIKAAIQVIHPKEVNYLQTNEKLTRHVFARNLTRAKAVTIWILDAFTVLKTCFEWESTKLNVFSLAIWILFCLFAKMSMLPLLLLIPFYWYRPKKNKSDSLQDLKDDKEDKNVSIRQRIQTIQEIVQSIQNLIGKLASIGESIKNLFNFTVPFVSFLAIFIIVIVTLVMSLIPFNYICLIWGIHKFTRKLLRPNRIPNSEVLDLLSRVPDDEVLMECEELPLADLSDDNEVSLKDLSLE